MKFLLDTNICIYIIKKQPVAAIEKFRQLQPLEVGVSTITVAELEYGIAKSRYPEKNRTALTHFLLPLVIVPFEIKDSQVYGQLRQALQAKGQPIGAMDMLIGAQALRRDVVLVTNNTREFARIDKLRLENWVH